MVGLTTQAVPTLITSLRLPAASASSLAVVSAGRPLFHRMPSGLSQWPAERPWRVCQEGAALLAAFASCRVLTLDAATAVELLQSQEASLSMVLAWHAQKRLLGLHTCVNEAEKASVMPSTDQDAPPPAISFMQLEPGAVVVGVVGAAAGAEAVWVGALLTLGELTLLASDALRERYATIVDALR